MSYFEYAPTQKLREGISIQKLVAGEEEELVLDDDDSAFNFPDAERDYETLYEYEDYKDHINLDCIKFDTEDLHLAETPFEAIALKMEDVTPDGRVKKRLVVAGEEPVPKDAMVYVNYNFYLEMKEAPIDSTYLREGKPVRLQLGRNLHLIGFEIAVQTMCVGETSQFLIHPDYAFGKMGAPPRIPPAATIFAVIHLEDVVDCGLADQKEQLSYADSKIFSKVRPFAVAEHSLGKHSFERGRIGTAIYHFQSEEKMLLNCRPHDDQEGTEIKQMLLKLYTNLAVCYNNPKKKDPSRVLAAAASAFKIDPAAAEKNAKLFYNMGLAKSAKGDFKEARDAFKEAQTIEPNNQMVWKQLMSLSEKIAEAEKLEKDICIRAFSGLGKGAHKGQATAAEARPEPVTVGEATTEPASAGTPVGDVTTEPATAGTPVGEATTESATAGTPKSSVVGGEASKSWRIEDLMSDLNLDNEQKKMVESMAVFLNDFAEGSASSISLGHGFSQLERRCYREISKRFGLVYEEHPGGRLRRNVFIRKQ